MNRQAITDCQDAFNDNLRKAKTLADILANCRAEQIQAESVLCIGSMLSENLDAIEAAHRTFADSVNPSDLE